MTMLDWVLEPGDSRRWQADGACRGVDPDVFFNERRHGEARAVCAECPVQAECLEYALDREQLGFWGGKTETERRRIRRRAGRRVRQNPVRTRGRVA